MIDSIVAYFNPKKALERARYRKALRAFEGASKGRRTKGWHAPSTDVNQETYAGLIPLRNRSRDLIRNNPHARSAQEVITTSVVGDGIALRIDQSSSESQKLYQKFLKWAESFECDQNGVKTFYGLQELAMNSIFESGEVLVKRVYKNIGKYKTVPLKIQLLESDFLDHNKNIANHNGNQIIQGKEYNKEGEIVAYWLFPTHPGSSNPVMVSERIDARDIIHVYDIRRPGQARGVPWLSSVIIALRELDMYQDAELVKQKIAACFAGFIHDISADGATTEELEATIGSHLEPGALEILPGGKTISFPTPPSTGSYTDFTRTNLRRIAAGAGPTYEALTSDYSQSNYSSSRMAERLFNKKVKSWQQNMFIPMFCETVWEWFQEAAILEGITKNKYTAKWVTPKVELINPKEDNEADIAAIRAGLESWADVVTARGKDPEEHLKSIQHWNKKLDDAGVIFDSDPRKVMKTGMLQSPTAKELTPDEASEGETSNDN